MELKINYFFLPSRDESHWHAKHTRNIFMTNEVHPLAIMQQCTISDNFDLISLFCQYPLVTLSGQRDAEFLLSGMQQYNSEKQSSPFYHDYKIKKNHYNSRYLWTDALNMTVTKKSIFLIYASRIRCI